MYAFWLAIFGAVCWGIAPAFGKVGLKGIPPIEGLAARTLITVFLVWGSFFVSDGISGIVRIKTISLGGWIFLAIEAFLATFAGDLAYYAAIKYGDVGKTAIVLAASPLITVWFGWYFLSENISMIKLIGGILIVIGVILVSFEY